MIPTPFLSLPKHLPRNDGRPKAVGHLLERHNKRRWVAGDTSVCEEMINCLRELKPIHTALLPVNKDNFFRRRRGIAGNMSEREAFGLAAEPKIEGWCLYTWICLRSTAQTTGRFKLFTIPIPGHSNSWRMRRIYPCEIY